MMFNFETRLKVRFKLIRLIDDRLESSKCKLELLLSLNNKLDAKASSTRLRAMKIWIESFVNGCVCYNLNTEIDTEILAEISNHVMMCHDEPHDHILLMLLHTKLTTIGGDDVLIMSSTLSSDTGEGFSCTASGPSGDCLPTMEAWIGERSFHPSPWWYRDDSSMFDMYPEEDEDLSIIPKLGENMIKLVQDLDKEEADEEADDDVQMAEIIKPKFKPRIIETD
jgi:hypothetical protein